MERNISHRDSVNPVSSASGMYDLPANPFVGLRPFNSNEGLLFFGRHEQTLELLKQLHLTRFLAVVGSSGCGKSSLIRAGLIPKLKAGVLVKERDSWHIATMKPGDVPLHNLCQSLLDATFGEARTEESNALVENVRADGAQAIIKLLTPLLEDSSSNFLLLIDQFEELFAFASYSDETSTVKDADVDSGKQQSAELDLQSRREEAADFVSLMLALADQKSLPIYVVMTMRSDFLGDCDSFYGLPEAMNRSQYLVPRLTRLQRQEAIENPIVLYGKAITPRLLDRVLNDAGEESDQLPVMQHALMRTWENWLKSENKALDLGDYEAAGTTQAALSNDAEQALRGMNEEDLSVTERLFQTLTDTDAKGRRVRRPAHVSQLQAITGASRAKLLDIIDRFHSEGRSFLTISQDQSDPLIDISHESLIRQWQTLRRWVDEEAGYRELYMRLAGAALRYYKEKPEDVLWTGPALQYALEWQEKRKPNRAWAERYHLEFDRAISFLQESKEQRDRDYAERERQQLERLESAQLETQNARLRRFVSALIAMFLAMGGFAVFAYMKGKQASHSALTAEQQTVLANDRLNKLNLALNDEQLAKQKAIDAEKAAEIANGDLKKANDDIQNKNDQLIVLQQKAEQEHRRAEEQAKAVGQTRLKLLEQLGGLYQQAIGLSRDADKTEEARKKFDEIFNVYNKANVRSGKISTLIGTAELYNNPDSEAEDQLKAVPYYKRALELFEANDNSDRVATLINLGKILVGSKDWQSRRDGATYYEEALRLGGPKDSDERILMLNDLGKVFGKSEKPEDRQKALKYFEQTLLLLRGAIASPRQSKKDTDDYREREISCLIEIGGLYRKLDDGSTANEYYQRALQVFKAENDPRRDADTLIKIGASFSLPKESQEAYAYFDRAVQRFQVANDLKGEATAFRTIGATLARAGDRNGAIGYYERAIKHFQDIKDLRSAGLVNSSVGSLYNQMNQKQEALKYYGQALSIYKEIGDQAREQLTSQMIKRITDSMK